MANIMSEDKSLWLFQAIYTGFSGRSDSYFQKHSQDMVNGLVGIQIPLEKLVDIKRIPDAFDVFLHVKKNNFLLGSQDILQRESEQTTITWNGIHFSKQVVFPLHTQAIYLRSVYVLPWLSQVVLLFFLCGVLGLGFTGLLIYSIRRLQDSERRNRATLDAAMDAVIRVDECGVVQEFNPSAERMFMYQRQHVLGCPIMDLIIPQAQRQTLKEHLVHYLATGEESVLGQPLEFEVVRSNGELFPIEVNIVEVVDGQHRLFTAFLKEITRRKKSERDLAQLAIVVQQSFNPIIVTDTDAVIQYVNPAFENISGYSSDEVIGKKPSIVKSGHHSQQYYANMWKALNAHQSWTGSFINKAKDGHTYHVEQTVFPLYVGDEHIGYTSVQQDVTERDQLQKKYEHTQRLESLGVLAGGIAHDFNNLLTAIMGNLGLANFHLGEGHQAAPYLERVQQASESAATLCQQMLAYSGKGQFVIEELRLSSIIDSILQLLESSIEKRVKLDVSHDDSTACIHADKGQIKQVIMNLVINAAEAIGEDNGVIEVRTTQIRLRDIDIRPLLGADDMLVGDYICLHVSDNGCGMDNMTQQKIFDPFFTTKFTGRGLGMSAILGIIRGHHGGMAVHSTLGMGTTFDVYFPVSKKDEEVEQDLEPQVLNQHVTGTVLVVDDEAEIRALARALLKKMGLNVLLAEDGLEGLQLVRQHGDQLQLVILDITMPRMDGEDLFKEIRMIAPDMPIIISSGYSEKDIKNRFGDELALTFVQKPYHLSVLMNAVQTLLDQKNKS